MKNKKKKAIDIRVVNPSQHALPQRMAESDLYVLANPLKVTAPHRLYSRITVNDQSLTVYSRSEKYTFNCTVDFRGSKFLIDDVMVEKKHQRQGIGFHLFCELLGWARRFSLEQIRLYALGGWIVPPDDNWDLLTSRGVRHQPELNGYYTWGRYGFRMREEDEARFRSWSDYFKCTQKEFPALLKERTDRYKWVVDGYGWRGYFFTDDNSYSSKHLEDYREERVAGPGRLKLPLN